MVLMNNKENEETVNLDIYRESFSDKNIGIDILNGKKYNLSLIYQTISTITEFLLLKNIQFRKKLTLNC